MRREIIVLLVILGMIGLFLYPPCIAEGVETAPRITDREIIESLAAIRGDIKAMDQSFNAIDKRFDELRQFMFWGFGVTFAGIFSLIGFVLWDRRTALAPAISKNRELEEREERLEKVLKEIAQKDSNVAEAMRHVGLL